MVENHIESPLVLVSRPVIGDGVFTEDLAMNRLELASDAVDQLGPFNFELTIQQALTFGPVGNVREAVIIHQVIKTGRLHMAGQTFPSVEEDPNGEREPRVEECKEKAEERMVLVVVEEQALAREYNYF